MKKSPLIKRTYRVRQDQDEKVKEKAKAHGGESGYIRKLIDKDK